MRRLLSLLACTFLLSTPALADYDAGKEAYTRKEWAKAITELRPLAEAGDDRAMLLLGNMYNDGDGVIHNPVEALRLYRGAALKNNAEAMIIIAAINQAGADVKPNAAAARQWFERAALLGNQAGAFFYAISLFQGDLSKKTVLKTDVPAAYKWFRIAAGRKGYNKVSAAAQEMAKALSSRIPPGQVAALDKEAAEWKPADPATLGPLPPSGLPDEEVRAPDMDTPLPVPQGPRPPQETPQEPGDQPGTAPQDGPKPAP